MATAERDYYEVLGVDRDAGQTEIKKAFRKLARELHPDVSEADAEERFKGEAVEAYEVLSKSETRELYDRFGHAGLRSEGFRPTTFDFGSLADIFSAFFGDDLISQAMGGRARGADIAASRDRARGSGRGQSGTFRSASPSPGRCEATGVEPGTDVTTCPTCQGHGSSRYRGVRSESSSARRPVPPAAAAGGSSSIRAVTAAARSLCSRNGRSRSRSRPASMTASGSRLSGEGHSRRSRRTSRRRRSGAGASGRPLRS